MDWIEYLTGWNLDQGNGTLELTIVLVLVAIAIAAGLWAWSRRHPAGRRAVR